MKKKDWKIALGFLFFLFFLFSLFVRFGGLSSPAFSFVKLEPITWLEVSYFLPEILLWSFIMTVVMVIIFKEMEAAKEKDAKSAGKRIAERKRKRLKKRERVKKLAERMNLLKLDANLRNIPVYSDNSSAVNRAYQLYRYKKNVFGEALRASKKS